MISLDWMFSKLSLSYTSLYKVQVILPKLLFSPAALISEPYTIHKPKHMKPLGRPAEEDLVSPCYNLANDPELMNTHIFKLSILSQARDTKRSIHVGPCEFSLILNS